MGERVPDDAAEPGGADPCRAETIVEMFRQRVAHSGTDIAVHFAVGEQFQTRTWNEFAMQVQRTAAGLVRIGVRPGDRVIQVSENRYEWLVTDLAIQVASAVHVPVHAPLTGVQVAWQINHSGAEVAILSGPAQAEKLQGQALPETLRLFSFEPCEPVDSRAVEPFDSLAEGVDSRQADEVLQSAVERLTADSLATILYTSGTTGEPKGVVLNQRNLVSNAVGTLEAMDIERADVRITLLPLSHIFARTCDMYTWLAGGYQIGLARNRETVLADCATLRPTLINAVPYFYEVVARHVKQQGQEDVPGILKQVFGGRMRFCASGGAALPDHLHDFYHERELPVLQGYGLTESSPVITLSTHDVFRRGAVGRALSGVEIKIDDDGEILTRGPHVMVGYYRDDAATAEAVRDGWLHTGDLGHLDDDGYLYITGRKKEILVTSGGKNIAPVYLESLLTEDPLILQALVVGDGRSHLAALIVPEPEATRALIMEHRVPVRSAEDALAHPTVRGWFQERIEKRLASVSHHEQVRRFKLLSRGFTIESGEMTPKLSLRRGVITANFATEIEAMYAEP